MPEPRSQPPAGAASLDERGRKIDSVIDRLTLTPSEAQPPPRRRIDRILACIGDDPADDVLSWTGELARLFDADVTLIHVMRPATAPVIYPVAGPVGLGPPSSVFPAPKAAEQRARAHSLLEQARTRIADAVPDAALLAREGHPGDEIVHAARQLASDLIILGPHEGGRLDRILLGSTTDHVKNHTQADILIARRPATPGPIVAAADGSPASRHAAALADAIAQRWSTTLCLTHVAPMGSRVSEAGMPETIEGVEPILRAGDARERLREVATQHTSPLLVVGARGASGLRSLMPGSVSNALAHDAPTSLLIVRAHAS